MRRSIFLIVGIVLLIAAGGRGYLAHRQYRSYQTLIPRGATSVIRIQVDALAKAIAWNALWNADDYRGSPGEGRTGLGMKAWDKTGMTIPANIFLYQLDHARSATFPNVFFGSLPVADAAAFGQWLGSMGMAVHQDSLGLVALSERAVVRFNTHQALFALSPVKPAKDLQHLTAVLDTLLRPEASVPVSKSRFAEIRDRSGHLCMMGTHNVTVDFTPGAVLFSVRQQTGPGEAMGATAPSFADSNAASLWFQGPLTDLLSGRQFPIGRHVLHGDSLLSHYRGRIVMEWRGTVMQQDTVIAYDYDENFDAVERREIVEKRVPEIYLSLLSDPRLARYLQAQGIVNATGDALNRDVFPLFQVGIMSLPGGYLQLHTAPQADAPPAPDRGAQEQFQLCVNFSKMDIPEIAPIVAPFVAPFDRLEANGQPTGDMGQLIRGKLLMKNQRINSLVQLLMPLQREEQPAAL